METMTPPPFCEPPAMRPQRKFSDSISFKILFIALLTLVLLIPDLIIYNAVDDREDRRLQAIDEIGQQWSRQQSLAGPQLVIPYRTHEKIQSAMSPYFPQASTSQPIFNHSFFAAAYSKISSIPELSR